MYQKYFYVNLDCPTDLSRLGGIPFDRFGTPPE